MALKYINRWLLGNKSSLFWPFDVEISRDLTGEYNFFHLVNSTISVNNTNINKRKT